MNWNAYPLAWARHAAARARAAAWLRRRLLTADQLTAIEAARPVAFYHPSVFVRLGLLLFTWFGLATGTGFALLLGSGLWALLPSEALLLVGSPLALALLCWVLLERFIIGAQRHFRSGVDNALLYTGLSAAAATLINLLHSLHYRFLAPESWLFVGLLALLTGLLVLAARRYTDPLVAALAWGLGLATLGRALLHLPLGRLLLPFAGLAAGLALHGWLRRRPPGPATDYLHECYRTLRALALATAYLSVNYLVVREGNAALGAAPGPPPLAPLFWLFTFALPPLYVGLALRRHDRLMLWAGVLALAFSLFTLRHYHALLPPAWAATLGGAALVLGSLAALRYLRRPRHGLTAAPDEAAPPAFNLETLVVAQTAPLAGPPEARFEFGGGQSAGGGAEGRF